MAATTERPSQAEIIHVLDAMESAAEGLVDRATAEYDGEAFYMSAAAVSSFHGRAVGYLFAHLIAQLQPGHDCSIDTRVAFDGRNGAPDVVVAETGAMTADQPIPIGAVHLIVEVVSPSTRHHDLGWKLEAAREAGVDYWVIEPSSGETEPWSSITVHRFAAEQRYTPPT